MRRTKLISVVVAAVILMVSTSACVKSPMLIELENASLDARVEVLSAIVAKHAGRGFKTLPRISMVDSDTFASEFAAHGQNAHASALADLLGGAYFPSRGILLNESRMEEEASTATERTRMQLLLMAHELTHALQEQIAGAPSKLSSLTHVDSKAAYGALLEGHARFAERRVAADLGIRMPSVVSLPQAKEYNTLAERGADKGLRYGLDFKYRVGEAYVTRVAATGGMEAVWRLFDAPPTRTVDLVTLNNVVAGTGDLTDHAAPLAEIVSDVYGDECSIVSRPLYHIFLYALFLGRSTEPGAEVLDHIEHGTSYRVRCAGRTLSDSISVLGHHDPSGGESLLSALREFHTSQLKEISGKYGIEVVDINSSQSQQGDVAHGNINYSMIRNGTKTDHEIAYWIGKLLVLEWSKNAEIDPTSAVLGRARLARLVQADNR